MEKKRMPCLRCGKIMLTTASRRFCRKCRRHNNEVYDAPIFSLSRDSLDANA
jgi:Zn finger protein HypA/HybF involved in hydrogenase expression